MVEVESALAGLERGIQPLGGELDLMQSKGTRS
jgi:hypothetical protein